MEGAVKLKFALLTVRFWVCVAPTALAVITSVPGLMAVTLATMEPEAPVIPVEGARAMVLPVWEVTVTGTLGTAFPAESLTLMVNEVLAPNDRELLPLKDRVVPMTLT